MRRNKNPETLGLYILASPGYAGTDEGQMKCQKCKKEMKRVAVVEIKNKIIQEDFYCKKCKKIIEMHFKLDK